MQKKQNKTQKTTLHGLRLAERDSNGLKRINLAAQCLKVV